MNQATVPPCYFTPAQIRNYNGKLMELLSLYLNIAPEAITADLIREVSESCGVDNATAYAGFLAELCGLDTIGADRAFYRHYFLPMVTELDPIPFLTDPYYQAIKLPKGEKICGKWKLRMQSIKPGEAFICDDLRVLPDGRMLPQVGFFMQEFPYPAVLENDREWMTLMPNETVTTLPAVKCAHGKVLTYGLGLGYFAFMAARKPEVDSVTVVELSADVIKLFREILLPQFPCADKIRIINADAFAYAETEMPRENYDFVFADIWHDAGDGRALYERMKTYEPRCPSTEFTYWIEDTIRCYQDPTLWP